MRRIRWWLVTIYVAVLATVLGLGIYALTIYGWQTVLNTFVAAFAAVVSMRGLVWLVWR